VGVSAVEALMEADELLTRKVLGRVLDTLLADAAIFESTVGHMIRAESANSVDVDAAGVDSVGCPLCAVDVLGEDSSL
jgi:hypothetical protein